MSAGADRWVKWTTIGCMALLALIADTVSYLHMHTLVELQRQAWHWALAHRAGDGSLPSGREIADAMAGRSGGVGWSNALVPQASSALSPPNRPYAL